MPQFNSLAVTTETEAVNEMLAAIGEAPIADIDTATHPDAQTCILFMKRALRQIMVEPWRFNTELGWGLAPESTQETWTDEEGEVTTLNVFTPPSDLIAWRLSRTPEQYQTRVDIRAARQVSGNPDVFYDIGLNRDGFDADKFDYLYIDYIRFVDWANLPQTARDYATAMATQMFVESTSDRDAANWNPRHVTQTYRNFKRDQDIRTPANIFDSPDSVEILGLRPRGASVSFTPYANPNLSS